MGFNFKRYLLFSPVLMGILLIYPSFSNASLVIFPTRIELSDQQKTNQLEIFHQESTTATYTIKAVFYRMDPNGAMTEVPNPSPKDRSAAPFLHFSPHSVTLKPNEKQMLRVMLTAPRNLPPGEYRAHLRFLPKTEMTNLDQDQIKEKSDELKKEKKIASKINVVFQVAVPAYFRHGNLTSNVKLSTAKLFKKSDEGLFAKFKVINRGNTLARGDFHVFFLQKNKDPIEIGQILSWASYLPEREAEIPLTQLPKDLKLKNGKIKVELNEVQELGGSKIAEKETSI